MPLTSKNCLSLALFGRGGTSQAWQRALGRVIVRDMDTHAHCNWDVRVSGTDAQRSAIERLLDDVRLEHPILKAGCAF